MLESADTELVAGGVSAAAAIEEPPDEVFEKRGIGVLAWIAIGGSRWSCCSAILAPVLPIKSLDAGYDYLHPKAGLFSPGTSSAPTTPATTCSAG